jgi:putative ABC transport system permease protein
VAIARALVNDPDIILADEPTGALDTETSVQVMEPLKEVARDRLVVMVTHNPELAETYSTRIIRMLDGKIIDDSAPLTAEEIAAEQAREQEKAATGKKRRRRERKPSMSFATSFGLSLKNLFTKKGRTTLTAFAGSIGIIGIALITAVSNGMTTYINTVQEDTLSSYPLTLQASEMNMGSLMATFIGNALSGEPHENDAVYEKTMVYDLVNALGAMEETTNDLKTFLDSLSYNCSYSNVHSGSVSTRSQYANSFNVCHFSTFLLSLLFSTQINIIIIIRITQKINTFLLIYSLKSNFLSKNGIIVFQA